MSDVEPRGVIPLRDDERMLSLLDGNPVAQDELRRFLADQPNDLIARSCAVLSAYGSEYSFDTARALLYAVQRGKLEKILRQMEWFIGRHAVLDPSWIYGHLQDVYVRWLGLRPETVVCGNCGKRFRFSPQDADVLRDFDENGGGARSSDPAGWIAAFSSCPACYDRAHGGTGEYFEEMNHEFEEASDGDHRRRG